MGKLKMKKVNVYNSNYENSVTIVLNSNERITINPKETVQIETNSWIGHEDFRIEDKEDQVWIEQYQGRYNENIILRFETEEMKEYKKLKETEEVEI